MKQKQLGNTNVTVPKIGLGTWKYEGGLEPLRQGIELGASSFIDTAEVYSTENAVGEGHHRYPRKCVSCYQSVGGPPPLRRGMASNRSGSLRETQNSFKSGLMTD